MNPFTILLLASLSLFATPLFSANPLINFCASTQLLSDSAFLVRFPYATYLDTMDLLNYRSLDSHCKTLKANGRNSKAFLKALSEHYLSHQIADITDFNGLKESIDIGCWYRRQLPLVIDDYAFEYKFFGANILNHVHELIESNIKNTTLARDDWQTRYLAERLADCKYRVDLPKYKWEKFYEAVGRGDWTYLWAKMQRYSKMLVTFSIIILCMIIGYVKYCKI